MVRSHRWAAATVAARIVAALTVAALTVGSAVALTQAASPSAARAAPTDHHGPLTATGSTIPSASRHAAKTAPEDLPAAGGAQRSVTLLTGDRVRLTDRGGRLAVAGIDPAPGRAGVGFTTDTSGGRLRVIPSDAQALLQADRLDPRLFDVAALLRFGYDDRREDLPLIFTGDVPGRPAPAGSTSDSALPAPLAEPPTMPGAAPGAPPTAPSTIPGSPPATSGAGSPNGESAVHAAKHDLTGVWRELSGEPTARRTTDDRATGGRWKVWLDGTLKPTLTESVPQIGAPAAWTAGLTGSGVVVGVLDSGIDASHPDLAGQVVGAKNFIDGEDLRDLSGHGTHVASTIAGTGAAPGGYRGVAPGAHLISARVCGPAGCPESAVLAGARWLADQGVKIINASLGGPDTEAPSPLKEAVNQITAERGVLFVISSGNIEPGDTDTVVSSPGAADAALTVGAVSKSDELATFSRRGPRLGDGALKPDITGPGVAITAARSSTGPAGDGPDPLHATMSGTSMAAPHVAGAAAIIAGEHPDWNTGQVKAALMGSARTNPTIDVYAQGAGRVDLTTALRQRILADPPSVSVHDAWPPESTPIVRTVTYRNTGSEPVTLSLQLRTSAAAGEFEVAEPSLTVPAGGTADAHLSVNTRVRDIAPTGGGYLVATAGDSVVTTPFVAAVDATASFKVDVTNVGRDGTPATSALLALVNPQTEEVFQAYGPTTTMRLLPGRYVATSMITSGSGDDPVVTMIATPVVVDHDTSLTMDARSARPVSVRMPMPDAADIAATVAVEVRGPSGVLYSVGAQRTAAADFFTGPAEPHGTSPALQSAISVLYAKRGVDPLDSPYVAHVAWRERGRMFAGLDRTVNARDLATVRAQTAHHALATGLVGYNARWSDDAPTVADQAPVRLPGSRLEYLNTDGGVRHQTLFKEGDGYQSTGNSLLSPVRTFVGGRRYSERRNVGVYGPGFSDPGPSQARWATRRGDTLYIEPTLFNDQLGWAGTGTRGDHMTLTLDRDGTRLATNDPAGAWVQLAAPAGDGQYRLGVDVTRGASKQLSTRVSTEWTFRSATTATDRWRPLPLSAVRFLPALNDENTAPAGVPFAVPVEVEGQVGSEAGPPRSLSVDVSYDDGQTWTATRVDRDGQRGRAQLIHPRGAGFVSLRASATDAAGNTVRETIIRAYRIA